MSLPEAETAGWFITGFHAATATWIWLAGMLLHGLYRSFRSSGADPIRPAGPID